MSKHTNVAYLHELEKCEDRRYKAMIERDLSSLADLLNDDLLYTHSSAKTDTKAQYLASLESGATIYKSVSRDQITIRVYDNIALINGHVVLEATVDGVDRLLDNMFLNAWVKTEKGWQMTAWASTPIPKK